MSGTAWQWQEFQSSNDTLVIPEEGEFDVVVFRPDETLQVVTACATGEGTWTDAPDVLDIDLAGIGRADCGEDSASALLLRDLDLATSYVLEDGDLFVALPMDGGIHQFSPSLAGITWSWVQFQGSDGTLVAPAAADSELVTFDPNGTVTIETSCASGMGTFSDTREGLALDVAGVDAGDCAEDSPAALLLRDLDIAASYVIHNGHLFIALPMDAGIHEFAPVWPEDAAA